MRYVTALLLLVFLFDLVGLIVQDVSQLHTQYINARRVDATGTGDGCIIRSVIVATANGRNRVCARVKFIVELPGLSFGCLDCH